jgi:hypothetical protein
LSMGGACLLSPTLVLHFFLVFSLKNNNGKNVIQAVGRKSGGGGEGRAFVDDALQQVTEMVDVPSPADDPTAATWEAVQLQLHASLDAVSGFSRDAHATHKASLSALDTSISGLNSRTEILVDRANASEAAAERLALTTKEMATRLDQHYEKLDVLAASATTAEKRANDLRCDELPKAIADAQAVTRISIDAEAQRVIGVMQARLDKEREERAAEQQSNVEERRMLEATVAKLAGAVREQEQRWVALEAALVRTDTRAATEAEDRSVLDRRLAEHVRSSAAAREADRLDRRDADAAAVAARVEAITLSESNTRHMLKKETDERVALAARVTTERDEVDAAIADSVSAAAMRAEERAEAAAATVRGEMIMRRNDLDARVSKHDGMLQRLCEQDRPAVNQRLDHLEEGATRYTLRVKACEKNIEGLLVASSRSDAAALALQGKVSEGFAGAMAAVAEAHKGVETLIREHDTRLTENKTRADELRWTVLALEARASKLDSNAAELYSRAAASDEGRDAIQQHLSGSIDAVKHVDASLEAGLRLVTEQQQVLAKELAAHREASACDLKQEVEARESVAASVQSEGVERRAAHHSHGATIETHAQRLCTLEQRLGDRKEDDEDDYARTRVEHERRLTEMDARADSIEGNMFSNERGGRQRLVEVMGAIRVDFEGKVAEEAQGRCTLEGTLQTTVSKLDCTAARSEEGLGSLEAAMVTTGEALTMLREGMQTGHERLERLIASESKARLTVERLVEQRLGFASNASS